MLSAALLLAAPLAWAGTPVLHLGDADGAVSRASDRSGVEAERFTPHQVGGPIQVGVAVQPCEAVAPTEELRASLEAAARDIDYGRFAAASAALEAAWASARCLQQDPDLLHRLSMLRGSAAMGQDRLAEARNAFSDAVRFSPAPWDPALPPEGQVLYDAALAQPPCCALWVLPSGAEVVVDARPHDPAALIGAGEHVVSVGDQAIRVELRRTIGALGANDTSWEQALAWPERPERHDDLLALVRAEIPEGRAIVDGPERSWQVGPDVVAPLDRARPLRWPTWTTIVGFSVAGAGTAISTGAWLDARAAIEDAETTLIVDQFNDDRAQYDQAKDRWTLGWVIGAAGATTASVGLIGFSLH